MASLTRQERAVLALWLVLERPMSTGDLARWLGMSWSGADRLMCRISRVVPLCKVNGLWHVARRGQKTKNEGD